MESIGTYLHNQLYSKMLVAPPKNPTDNKIENGWFETTACRAIRGKGIKS